MDNGDQWNGLDRQVWVESRKPLGIREIGERMEVSPLLAGQGDMIQGQDFVCCTCKIGPDVLDEDGLLPMIFSEGDDGDISDERWWG